MNFFRQLPATFRAKSEEGPASRLQISNLTRQTEIASCAEVADNGAARRKGLLGRSNLAPGTGLWIVPCESVHTFFMKFPIDLIYIDRNRKVKKVRSNVGPWRMSACLSAHSIIELPVGVVLRTQTVAGDQLEFSLATEAGEDGDTTLQNPIEGAPR